MRFRSKVYDTFWTLRAYQLVKLTKIANVQALKSISTGGFDANQAFRITCISELIDIEHLVSRGLNKVPNYG